MSDFSIGRADERMLGVFDYLLGFAELSLILAALGYGAVRIRRLLLPGWGGALGLLVDLVLGTSAAVLISELLGTVGIFGEWELIVAVILFAVGAAVVCDRVGDGRTPAAAPVPPQPPHDTFPTIVAMIGVAGVVAAWMVPTLGTLAAGMDRADSLWYHMPLSASFVQTGSLGDIFYFDPIFFASFYPANSEVLHAIPMLVWDRDIVSPLLNMAFLGMGLVASWCIGRPYGVGPQALIGGSIALGAQMLVEFQAGEALNDIVGVVFILVAVALLVNGYAARAPGQSDGHWIPAGALAIAGLATGLAAGVKLSFLAPAAALTIGVIVIAPKGRRLWAARVWSLPAIAAGIYWYARNAIATGNPIPFASSIGPINLPSPARDFELRPGHAVAYYWNDIGVWSDFFVPGLIESFGILWPVTLVVMLGGAMLALARRNDPILRLLGVVVLVTTVAYLFTPLTAAGQEGKPIAFEWNLRYLAASVAVGMAMLPCLPIARSTARRRLISLLVLFAILAVTIGSLVQWKQGHVRGAVAAAILVIAGTAAFNWMRSRGYIGPAARRRSVLIAVASTVFVVAVAGWFEQRHYLKHRFENTSPRLGLADALRFGRDLRDGRVAVAGIRGVFNQYPLYGTDLSNDVQWLGIEGEHKAWLRIPTCEQWREALNAGDYTHVFTAYDPYNPDLLSDTKEALWTRKDPASETLLRKGPVSVFEITGDLDPAGCEGLPSLSKAELNGRSVNAEPLANQP